MFANLDEFGVQGLSLKVFGSYRGLGFRVVWGLGFRV